MIQDLEPKEAGVVRRQAELKRKTGVISGGYKRLQKFWFGGTVDATEIGS